MKKRRRKKLHGDAGRELGFEVRVRLRPGLGVRAQEQFFDAFLAEAIEAPGLCFGGGAGDGFATKRGRGPVTEEHRSGVDRWLAGRAEVAAHEVGPLQDARTGEKPIG